MASIRPPRLRPGDAVAVVAPSGPVPRERFFAGERILSARYRLVYGERLFERTGFLAGGDDARLAELQAALEDPSVNAIVCARGGYGAMRLLPRLPAPPPKLLVGFSDITALHAWAARSHLVTLHAPVVTQLGALPAEDAQVLIDLMEGVTPPPIEGLRLAAGSGRAEGVLLGGNLEIVSRLAGTPWQLDLDGAILLLEEVGEQPYRIDRALTQLELAGALAGVRGVVVGDLHRCEDRDKPDGPSAEAVVVERLGRLGVPLWLGLPIGHGARNRAVPLGVRVEVADGRLGFLEPAVA